MILQCEWWIDLPELTSIRLGSWAFVGQPNDTSSLVMRNDLDEEEWKIDLPKLISLTTTSNSNSFGDVRLITLESTYASYYSFLDMPSLTNVVLCKEKAFKNKKEVNITGSPPSSLPSPLDIGALQPYLNSSLSFTHKLLICNALFPVFKTIFVSLSQSNTRTPYHNWTPFSLQFPCSP